MAENKEKVSSTVHYEMSQADYNLLASYAKQSPELQEILARVRVVDDKAPVTPTKNVALVNPAAKSTEASVVKEQLTDDVQKRLFGENYNHVCIYDNEKQKLLTRKCNDVYVSWYNDDTVNSKKLKELFEKAFPKFELVAQVTLQASGSDYPEYAIWSKVPVKFNENGEYTVGNLVIRNKKTGKLELLKAGAWFGVHWHKNSSSAIKFGAGKLAFNVLWYLDFRAKLFADRSQR